MAGAVFLFTGQGSQSAGMGKALFEAFAAAREVFAEADEALGEPLSRLILEGPEERLALTAYTQPAVLTVDLAVYRCLGATPAAAAGHSLGEYAALVAAGSLGFADAVRLVRARALAMQEAVPVGAGGMVVLRKATLEEARSLAASATAGLLELANLNGPGQYVLSGESAAVDELVERLGPRRALKLPVSVPFHCSLLRAAGERFAGRLAEVEFKDPRFPVVCNVDARPVAAAAEVRDALARQFSGPVLWEPSMRLLLGQGRRLFVECGPKPTLVRLLQAQALQEDAAGVEVHAPVTAEEVHSVRARLAG